MIIGIIIIGALLIVAGLRGTEHELAQQLMMDTVGPGGFIAWAVAILLIGALGLIPMFHTASRYMLLLLFVVIVVENHNVFEQAQQAIQTVVQYGPAPAVKPAEPVSSSSSSGSGSSSSGGSGGILGAIGGVASAAKGIASIASLF